MQRFQECTQLNGVYEDNGAHPAIEIIFQLCQPISGHK